jgi:DNA-binding transcriptional regulator LsrR (DeoR family)
MKDAQEYQEYRRDEFIGIIRAAKIAGATQQNIADASGLSRQRIQQLLKKSNRTGS